MALDVADPMREVVELFRVGDFLLRLVELSCDVVEESCNRVQLRERLGQALSIARRDEHVAVLYLDLATAPYCRPARR